MISKGQIEQLINHAESQFLKCWSFLAAMRKGKLKETRRVSLTTFQPILATAIFDLTKAYRELEQEKNRLINRKQTYSAKWFVARMRFLSDQQKILNDAISIGRGIGDAFAWFFYRRDRHYLTEHLAQPAQHHTPPGIGGIGELEFVKHVPHMHGYFVLYHGITNILRLGDLTLIDLNGLRVAGIGELKSHSIEKGMLNMTLLVSGPKLDQKKLREDLIKTKNQKKSAGSLVKLSQKQHERLKRQMQRISTSYKNLGTTPELRLKVGGDSHFDDLTDFVARLKIGQFSYKKLGQSLLLIGYKGNKTSLYKKLSDSAKTSFKEKLADVESHAIDLMISGRDDNAIIVGSLYYNSDGMSRRHIPGMTHLVWWPISEDVIKNILFQDVMVLTIFNPAHFFAALEKSGFSVEQGDALKYKIFKKCNGYEVVVEGTPYYLEMIQQYFVPEETIISLLNETEGQVAGRAKNGLGRIDIQIEQSFGTKPT